MSWGRRTAGPAVAGVLTIVSLGGCGGLEDCVRGGPSVIELRLPSRSWEVSSFCVDDECLPASDLQPGPPEDEGLQPVFYSYVVEVDDTPRTYRYRVELTAPDGRSVTEEGDVRTAGNTSGGENCEPTWSTASLTIGDDGEVTVQSP
jgi:hypothetical protein